MNSVSIPRRPSSRARAARWAGSGTAMGADPIRQRVPLSRTSVRLSTSGRGRAMTQMHLDRLSAIDAGFLAQERPNTHMHIGGLVLLDGPPPALGDFLAHVRSRLHLVPRSRQKLVSPPLEAGLPLWIDDPTFNLEYHVRHTALPAPGDEHALLTLAARIFSQRLDRSKPL